MVSIDVEAPQAASSLLRFRSIGFVRGNAWTKTFCSSETLNGIVGVLLQELDLSDNHLGQPDGLSSRTSLHKLFSDNSCNIHTLVLRVGNVGHFSYIVNIARCFTLIALNI
jgi:hypothetical protein